MHGVYTLAREVPVWEMGEGCKKRPIPTYKRRICIARGQWQWRLEQTGRLPESLRREGGSIHPNPLKAP
jgi:hypothetical protein